MRLLIVDDNAHFLEAARDLLEREGMTVVAVASTSAEALRRADELQPDVTLVDVDLGDDSGFDLARQLAAATSGARDTGDPDLGESRSRTSSSSSTTAPPSGSCRSPTSRVGPSPGSSRERRTDGGSLPRVSPRSARGDRRSPAGG